MATTAQPSPNVVMKTWGLVLGILPTLALTLYVLKQSHPPSSVGLSMIWDGMMVLLLLPSYLVPIITIIQKGDRGYALGKGAMGILVLAYGGLSMVIGRLVDFRPESQAATELSTIVLGWVMTAGLVSLHMLLMTPVPGQQVASASAK